jgi:hypothetical protein
MSRLDLAGVCCGPDRERRLLRFLPLGATSSDWPGISAEGYLGGAADDQPAGNSRSNVINLRGKNGSDADESVAELVEKLNSQICSYTAANKFASFFTRSTMSRGRRLPTATSHNPPLYFGNGDVSWLAGDGGRIFADTMRSGDHLSEQRDLLGVHRRIVKCVNEYGEEFGESRH